MVSLGTRIVAAARSFATPILPVGEHAKVDPSLMVDKDMPQYNPSELITRQGLDTFDKMRRDDQIKAAMTFKKHAVLVSGWEIQTPESQKQKNVDWEVAEFVQWNLKNMAVMTDTFEESLLGVLSALEFGFSVSEKTWEIRNTPFGERAVLTGIKGRHPKGFEFRTDGYGNLAALIQADATAISAEKVLDPEKFVIFSYSKEFGNWYGHSDLEAAYRPWWLKANVYQWLSMYMERLGIPPVFAMYDPTAYNTKQKNDLKNVISNLQAATSGIIPRPHRPDTRGEDTLSFWTPELGLQVRDVFVPTLDMLNRDISRALLMPGLIGFTPDDAAGSYARAEKHFDSFLMIVDYVRHRIQQRVVQEQIIKPLVDFNYPNVEEYPQFQFLPMTDDVRTDILKQWGDFVEKGVVTPQVEDEDHIRSLYKFPERNDDTQDDEGDGIKDATPDDTTPDDEYDDQLKSLLSDTDEGSGIMYRHSDNLPHTPADAPSYIPKHETTDPSSLFESKYENAVDFAQVARDLDALEAQAEDELIKVFLDVRDNTIRFVTQNWEKGIMKKMSDFRLRGIVKVRPIFRDMLHSALRAGQSDVMKELKKEFSSFAQPSIGLTPKEAIAWFDKWEEFYVTGVIKDDLTKDVHGVILNSIKTGETLADTQAKLANLFEPFVGNPKVIRDGALVTAARLQTIIRTNVTNAYNQGRLTQARRNADLVQGMQYSAVLDNRTTAICESLHGRIFRLNDPDLGNYAPPNHMRCRSLLVPVSISQVVDEDDWITPGQKGRVGGMITEGFGGKAKAAAPAPSAKK